MPRTRGVTVELLDHDKLTEACKTHGLARPSLTGNALLRNTTGEAVVLSYEGVAGKESRPGMAVVDTMSHDWEYLPIEAVEACRTGETEDLADFIRTFGDRLNANHWHWHSWATRSLNARGESS